MYETGYFKIVTLKIIGIFCLGPTLAIAAPQQGHRLVISTVSPQAVEMGRDIALKGGNVVDVAVTVAFTLAVTHPYFAALGGGGFALVKEGRHPVAVLDFREQAPFNTSPKFYLSKGPRASLDEADAIGVPGIVAGLWAIHQRYGKLPWTRLFSGPIRLAKKGFRVSGEWVDRTRQNQKRFSASGRKHFFKKSGDMYQPGEIFKQMSLAMALQQIRTRRTAPFYRGRIAKDIVNSVKAAGGGITLKDLSHYKVRWLTPIVTDFQGYKIYLMPPPSSGGVVLKSALTIIDQLGLQKIEPFSVDEFHLMGEVLNRSFRARSLLGDPDFHTNPLERLLSKDYLLQMGSSIKYKTQKLKPLNKDFGQRESAETTHLSVLDSHGNAVAMTLTLNGAYGSGIVSQKYGIALNNEMDDFTTRPHQPNLWGLIQGPGNQVEPGKRPLSSMSPTLVEKDNKIVMALGAAGGPKIISAVLQTLYRVLVTGLDMDQAIQAPRVHHQFLPHTLYLDRGRFVPETIKGLQTRLHQTEFRKIGRVFSVKKNKDFTLEAAHDSRGEGASGGW